jgi:hypothetical protein
MWQLLVIASPSTRFSGSFYKQGCKVSMNMVAELPEMKR